MTTEPAPTTAPISPIAQIEQLSRRLEKARDLFAQGKVHPIVGMDDHYAVECSRIDSGMYLVNALCTCVDAQQRSDVHHGWCKHKLAVELYKEAQASKDATATDKPRTRKGKAADNGANHGNGSLSPEEAAAKLEREIDELYPPAR